MGTVSFFFFLSLPVLYFSVFFPNNFNQEIKLAPIMPDLQ